MKPITPELRVLEDADKIAREAARRILARAEQAIVERGRFRVVLAGGTTPLAAYRRLVAAETNWSAWEIYFGDERCLPIDHAERNSRSAGDVWLDKVPLAADKVHPIPAERGADAAARIYEANVRAAVPFDLVLLGVGEDGHTASLFPGQAIPPDRLVIPVREAPKPPAERVSLTPAAFADAGEILILVSGRGKRQALQAWREREDLPIARAATMSRSLVLADRAAVGSMERF